MKKMTRFMLICLISLIVQSVYSLNANNGQNTTLYENDGFKMGFGLQTSFLNGESNELVYSVDHAWDRKISHLIWELNDCVMFGGIFSMEFNNRLYLNIGTWKNVSGGDGKIEDWDYMSYILWMTSTTTSVTETVETGETDSDGNPETEEVTTTTTTYTPSEIENLRTHYSQSETTLETGSQFDFNIAYTFLQMGGDEVTSFLPMKSLDSSLSFQGVFGYKYDKWEWESKGGYYLYNMYSQSPGSIYPYSAGTFENTVGLTYEHNVKVPYVGFNMNLNNNNYGVGIYLLYSQWVQVESIDHHVWRNLMFKDTFDEGTYWGYGINFKWDFKDRWTLTGSYHTEKVKEIRGDTFQTDLSTGESVLWPYGAGFSHKNDAFTIGCAVRFG